MERAGVLLWLEHAAGMELVGGNREVFSCEAERAHWAVGAFGFRVVQWVSGRANT